MINMTSSCCGWQGNILGIKQNGSIVGVFGGAAQSGSSFPPVYFTVQGDLQVEVVVFQQSYYSNYVGFDIKVSNGTTIC